MLFCFFPAMLWANDQRITTSIRPLQSIIANIMDRSKEVDLIIDKNESLHHFQLKPSKVIAISNSDMIIIIDRNFEVFLDKAIDTLSDRVKLIEVAKLPNIMLLKNEGDHHKHEDEDEDEEDEHHHSHATEYDYHLWLDPSNVKIIARELTNIFGQRYPDSAQLYHQNLAEFEKKLDALDSRIRAKLLLARGKNFIVSHNAYNYFITRYGLNKPQALSIDHDHNIGARDLFTLQQSIEANKVKCIFEEPQFNSKLIEKLQANTTVKVSKLDAEWGEDNIPIEAVYFNLMDSLADDFSQCLN